MTTKMAIPGTCQECQQVLVQVIEDRVIERTYHPYNVTGPCAVLIPLNDKHKSANVPPEFFIPKQD